jgi:transcriptional regulator with XRE-family HTH domain
MEQVEMIDGLADRAKRAGLTMAKVCERAGVAQSTPSRWRAGTSGMTLAAFRKLERVVEQAESQPLDRAREAA